MKVYSVRWHKHHESESLSCTTSEKLETFAVTCRIFRNWIWSLGLESSVRRKSCNLWHHRFSHHLIIPMIGQSSREHLWDGIPVRTLLLQYMNGGIVYLQLTAHMRGQSHSHHIVHGLCLHVCLWFARLKKHQRLRKADSGPRRGSIASSCNAENVERRASKPTSALKLYFSLLDHLTWSYTDLQLPKRKETHMLSFDNTSLPSVAICVFPVLNCHRCCVGSQTTTGGVGWR